jgi:phosphodiester glycosidase/flagellar hook capping protein FlgD
MPLRLLTVVLLAGFLAAPAQAQGIELMPGVTFERTVQFTPHGPVALNVLTAPKPGGLYQVGPVLSRGTVSGGAATLTQIERSVSSQATVAGINGDLTARDGTPAGIVVSGGALLRPPLSTRSSIGIDSAGTLHVDRVRFVGTWKGTGQRRPIDGLNRVPIGGQVILYTPSYGAAVPRVPGSVEVTLQPFPATVPNTDLTAPVTAVGAGGGEAIPPDGAILQATGTNAAKLQAEAPVGTALTARLILQPTWDGVGSALGGGPVLVRDGKAVFRSGEDFQDALIAARSPRAGVGQLADGRVILVAVDGDQPGYSAGMTTFELAQTMQRLGAVTASAVGFGNDVTMAFDGSLLDRPSREQPVREGLLVQYFGVYAPPPAVPVLNGDPSRNIEPLSYKLVRPSRVIAQLIGPDGVAHVLEADVSHPAGVYPETFDGFNAEGTWHWRVQATDDLGRLSTTDRSFRYDTTLHALAVPKLAQGRLAVRFNLSRDAKVRLRVETQGGLTVRDQAAVSLARGPQQLVWDGRLARGTRAYAGSYLAHLFVTSDVGTSELIVPFGFRR